MDHLTAEEGAAAVIFARKSLESSVRSIRAPPAPPAAIFKEKRGVFVTLTKGGELRGCIGFPFPVLALGEAITQAAHAAALEDPRFPPVTPRELPDLRVEVTILTVPQVVTGPAGERPSRVEIGRHGVIVKGRGTSGLLLPQVATEYGWDPVTFLDHTCRKAGLPAGCWKDQGIEISLFEGQILHEQG